jgi:hypothetical protein
MSRHVVADETRSRRTLRASVQQLVCTADQKKVCTPKIPKRLQKSQSISRNFKVSPKIHKRLRRGRYKRKRVPNSREKSKRWNEPYGLTKKNLKTHDNRAVEHQKDSVEQ